MCEVPRSGQVSARASHMGWAVTAVRIGVPRGVAHLLREKALEARVNGLGDRIARRLGHERRADEQLVNAERPLTSSC